MSLAALALRLAAVEALAPSDLVATAVGGGSVTWPTAAGMRVYDTYGGVDAKDPEADNTPIVCVFTEEVSGGAQGGDWSADLASPFRTVTNLVFEVEVNVLDNTAASPEFIVPPTFPEAEALLNLICSQICRTLQFGRSGRLFRKVVTGIYGAEMLPMREQLMGTRFARMTLRLRICHYGDDWTEFRAGAATLPDPLATVAANLPAASYGTPIIANIAASLQADPAAEPLEAIMIGLDIGRTPPSIPDAPVQGHADTDGELDF